ncbi:MAG: LytTR family DNA-binding domain-containing protein [Crocinitomicaceae bacterium]
MSGNEQSPIKVIIVDDETSAIKNLSSLIQHINPRISIVATAEDLAKGIEAIKEHKPDVVFLDIEMPNYAGYEIINLIDKIDFEIVFVTAYNQYALKAFELAALDYIVKPVEIERLEDTLQRIEKRQIEKVSQDQVKVLNSALNKESTNQIIVIDKGYKYLLKLEDVIAFEAQRAYCNIHTIDGKTYCASKNLKHFESILIDSNLFFRIHKSWLINLNHIQSYAKSKFAIFLSNNIEGKISKYRIAEFEIAINQKKSFGKEKRHS